MSAFFAVFLLLFPVSVSAAQATAPPIQYLESNSPGVWSLLISTLSETAPRKEAKQQLYDLLDNGIANGFSSALTLEQAIINLRMLGEDPENYQGNNLVTLLSTYDNLSDSHLKSACFALIAYEASNAAVLETSRNSLPALTDFIVSSQQRTGGFAHIAGKSPCPQSTAEALLALSPQKNLPHVKSAIDRAIDWLSKQQNPDGSFSKSRKPSCEATAAVLTALRVYGITPDDPRFTKETGILEALSAFETPDGSYASHIGEPASVEATESAVLALYANESGRSPYLPLKAIAHPKDTKEETASSVYLQFLISFLGMLAIIYVLLLLTAKLGKKSGGHTPQFKNPYVLDEEESSPAPGDTQTLEINIQMKAAVPNFDEIGEPPVPPISEQTRHLIFSKEDPSDQTQKPLE